MRPILVYIIIIQSLVAFLLTPKYVTFYDFEWLEWQFYVLFSLLRTATGSLFVAYLVSFVYYSWCEERAFLYITSLEERTSVGSGA